MQDRSTKQNLTETEGSGSFSIPCHVGPLFMDKALCDLGASVSVMPLSINNKINLGVFKCTQITLHMEDRSMKYLLRI